MVATFSRIDTRYRLYIIHLDVDIGPLGNTMSWADRRF